RTFSEAEGRAGIDHMSAVRSSVKSDGPANERLCDEVYCFTATTRINTEITIHSAAQNIAGMPVAFAIFKASVGTVAANGEDRKKTVFKSSSAFKTHCTASRLTTKLATLALANRATANSPTDSSTPATSVKGSPANDPHVPARIGLITPKITVRPSTTTDEAASTTRAATDRRINTRRVAPKVIAPK